MFTDCVTDYLLIWLQPLNKSENASLYAKV